jgi:hypothetical protein
MQIRTRHLLPTRVGIIDTCLEAGDENIEAHFPFPEARDLKDAMQRDSDYTNGTVEAPHGFTTTARPRTARQGSAARLMNRVHLVMEINRRSIRG